MYIYINIYSAMSMISFQYNNTIHMTFCVLLTGFDGTVSKMGQFWTWVEIVRICV